jgi:hypothetical protein
MPAALLLRAKGGRPDYDAIAGRYLVVAHRHGGA